VAEAASIEKFLVEYFAYAHTTVDDGQPSCMAKIFGVYNVGLSNPATSNAFKTCVIVVENVFYGFDVRRKFDLKGSIRNRMVDTAVADSNLVLMDQNLLNIMCENPLYLSFASKQALIDAVHRDSDFLDRCDMMDYSMLVGVAAPKDGKGRGRLVLGIVDYIRTFTWDKKVEQMVKQSGIVGGDRRQPTIVSPNIYSARFKEAMYKYFVLVPDHSFVDQAVSPVQASAKRDNGGGEQA